MRNRIALVTLGVAIIVFCVVQDRVTAAGARRYVAMQRAALAAGQPPVAVDDIMKPAIARSVRDGLLWSGGVVLAGVVIAAVAGRRG
jgi:hypothetical protein